MPTPNWVAIIVGVLCIEGLFGASSAGWCNAHLGLGGFEFHSVNDSDLFEYARTFAPRIYLTAILAGVLCILRRPSSTTSTLLLLMSFPIAAQILEYYCRRNDPFFAPSFSFWLVWDTLSYEQIYLAMLLVLWRPYHSWFQPRVVDDGSPCWLALVVGTVGVTGVYGVANSALSVHWEMTNQLRDAYWVDLLYYVLEGLHGLSATVGAFYLARRPTAVFRVLMALLLVGSLANVHSSVHFFFFADPGLRMQPSIGALAEEAYFNLDAILIYIVLYVVLWTRRTSVLQHIHRHECCGRCGYRLAVPDAVRCSECGATIPGSRDYNTAGDARGVGASAGPGTPQGL